MSSFLESLGLGAVSSCSVDISSIPWQSLSTDVSLRIKQGSLRISHNSFRVEYAPIHEEGERLPLLTGGSRRSSLQKGVAIVGLGEPEEPKRVISWPIAAFFLVNTAMGAGILNFPALYHKAGGVFMAVGIQAVMVFLLAGTMLVLAYCSDQNGDRTYHDVLLSVCGRRLQQITAFSILLTCYGICIAFLIVIGDQCDRLLVTIFGQEIFCNTWYLNRKFTITIIAVTIILPMAYLRDLSFLKYVSSLGILAMLYPVFLTAYEYFTMEVQPQGIKTKPDSILNVLEVIPLICIAYQSHEVVVPVYSQMEKRKITEFAKSTVLALAFLLVMYAGAGAFGYLAFGASVGPDIMTMYNPKDPAVLVGLAMLAFKMTTTYPPMILCGRGAVDGLYAEFAGLSASQYIEGERKRQLIITTIWFITTVILALYTPDIGVVLELLGCVASCNIFVYPGICLLMTSLKLDSGPRFYFLVSLSLIMIILGTFSAATVFLKTVLLGTASSSATELLCK